MKNIKNLDANKINKNNIEKSYITIIYDYIYPIISNIYNRIVNYSNNNLIKKNKIIYVCGVFDLCHVSHKIHFEHISKLGNTVYVGVHNDEVVSDYKRSPYMTHEERCLAVKKCKYVDKVFSNAELIIPTQFLIDNKIDIVACSDEYFNIPGDLYYKSARDMGILVEIPRDTTISTSELIDRIQSRVKNKNK
jgi:cytidyltransferase-like protein